MTKNQVKVDQSKMIDGAADLPIDHATQGKQALSDEAKQHVLERILKQLSRELQLAPGRVRTAVTLLDEGNTIPFIARYRKEMTGELDENELRSIEERLAYLRNLEDRKLEVLRLIEEQGKLAEELRLSIEGAGKLQEVEDLYRPYRQKRKTRASVAKERGLEPLAHWIWAQPKQGSLEAEAQAYVQPDGDVPTVADAIQGAMDIIAEMIADDPKVRAWVRTFTQEHGVVVTEAKDKSAESVYEMYYSYREPLKKLPPHRTLAINRGEREEVLKVSLEVPTEQVHEQVARHFAIGSSVVRETLQAVIEDSYKRLIAPSIEREVRGEATAVAEEQAIQIFAQNLRALLLQAPVKGKVVLGVDPAYRTGCKLAVIDATGRMLAVAVTYPTPPMNKVAEAKATFKRLIDQYGIELIVIGNGTASRETEQFVAELLQELQSGDGVQERDGKKGPVDDHGQVGYKQPVDSHGQVGQKASTGANGRKLQYLLVSEAGASVYSASKLAAAEFPDLDVAERSAISIARRLQDPLAELVKIEPKAIGVGQYQHDVSQKRLEDSLGGVVESAVNHVGVDLNTASPSLLSYVAGVNTTIAKNIVVYREEKGAFDSRAQLLKVPRLGANAYEQCVGFLRISGGANPLDNTPIHPESYDVVNRLLLELGLTRRAIGTAELLERLSQPDAQPEALAERLGVGVPTLRDIVSALQRPGRDPRDELAPPLFRTDVLKPEDLLPGMELQGTIRNVTDFGAFVDIGLKNDGLVHISKLSKKFVKHPMDIVAVGDIVTVWVLSVDLKKQRVSLTMVSQ